jgi:hypothetical protein
MRVTRTILILLSLVAGFCLIVVVTLRALKSDYLRFMEDKDQQYYSEFARACDSMLSQHPVGTNESIRISGDDLSLPKIVRDLQPKPSRVTISSNRVHIMAGVSRPGFGIEWQQDEMRTNVWVLRTAAEGLIRVAYEERR